MQRRHRFRSTGRGSPLSESHPTSPCQFSNPKRGDSPRPGHAFTPKAPSPVAALPLPAHSKVRSRRRNPLECGGRVQRRHRFRSTERVSPLSKSHPTSPRRLSNSKRGDPRAQVPPHSSQSAVAGRWLPLPAHSKVRSRRGNPLECGGRVQRRHRFRSTGRGSPLSKPRPTSPRRFSNLNRGALRAQVPPHSPQSAVAGRWLPLPAHSKVRSRRSNPLECGGRVQRRHRFRSTGRVSPLSKPRPTSPRRFSNLNRGALRAQVPPHSPQSAVAGLPPPLPAHSKVPSRQQITGCQNKFPHISD